MDGPEQARAYSEADFAEAHQRVADELVIRFPELAAGPAAGGGGGDPPAAELTARVTDGADHLHRPLIVDLGCGPADVTARVAVACPTARIVGVDAGSEMLRLGRRRIESLGLAGRVTLERRHLPDPTFDRRFDAVVSNSLLHHLADPLDLWRTVAAVARPGAPVLVMDLRRPTDRATVDALVATYATDAPTVLRDDFRNSLCAAYRPAEVAEQLTATGLDHLGVEPLTDRHLLVSGRR